MAKGKDTIKVIVTPASDNAYKERFLKINAKVIPFGIPVELDQNTISAIKRIKEPKSSRSAKSVYDVMDELKITQEKANKLMRENPDISSNVGVKFVPKYNISKV